MPPRANGNAVDFRPAADDASWRAPIHTRTCDGLPQASEEATNHTGAAILQKPRQLVVRVTPHTFESAGVPTEIELAPSV